MEVVSEPHLTSLQVMILVGDVALFQVIYERLPKNTIV